MIYLNEWARDNGGTKQDRMDGCDVEPGYGMHMERNTEKGPDLVTAMMKCARPAHGTPVETYLRSRGITIPIPQVLRYLPRCRHSETNTHWPAMIAPVIATYGRDQLGVHITYLTEDGQKAPVSPVKRMIGKVSGGAVHLGEPEENGVLLVTEGIETGLAMMTLTGMPVWAALSAWGVGALLPSTIPAMTIICADNDVTGIDGAEKLAERLWALGLPHAIELPPVGMDFADVAKKKAATMIATA